MKIISIAVLALIASSDARHGHHHHRHSLNQDEPANEMEEIAAKSKVYEANKASLKIQKAHEAARMKGYNPFTGLLNFPDGHREFIEGGDVGGANNWA